MDCVSNCDALMSEDHNHMLLGYQLKAFCENISDLASKPWSQVPILQQNIHVSSLSTELVSETLDYFLNCGQRLSQMTKTYHDSDAYILLLQEKEVDLELAARIGQDLLKQNKQLRENIKSLEDELTKRQDEVQQLRHELASKTTLLDTFIEEEEENNQTSRADNDGESAFRHQDLSITNQKVRFQSLNKAHISLSQDEQPDTCNQSERLPESGYLPVEVSSQKSLAPLPMSLSPNLLPETERLTNLRRDETTEVSANVKNNNSENNNLVQSVTFQLVESNKRLCELQDELFYKNELNLTQHESIRNLQGQLRESESRLHSLVVQNESLHKTISDSNSIHKDIVDELRICKRNFSELLSAFLELQKESRFYRSKLLQDGSNVQYNMDTDPLSESNNISLETFNNISFETIESDCNEDVAACNNLKPFTAMNDNTFNLAHNDHNQELGKNSRSLYEELEESAPKSVEDRADVHPNTECNPSSDDMNDNSDSEDSADGKDSGVQTNNRSMSVTPISNSFIADTDYEEICESISNISICAKNDGVEDMRDDDNSWVGLSSFMISTLLLLCISVTFASTSSYNLTSRMALKFEN